MSLITVSRESAESLAVSKVFALFCIELGVECEVGHTDHSIQGRANLMAHIGEGIRFWRDWQLTRPAWLSPTPLRALLPVLNVSGPGR